MSKTLRLSTNSLDFCCGFEVFGEFNSASSDDWTKEQIKDQCSNGTGLFISTFNLDEEGQLKAFKRLSKWFNTLYRVDEVNNDTKNMITLVVFDTKVQELVKQLDKGL